MWKCFLFLVVGLWISLVTTFRGLMLGSGQWLVQRIEPCENPEQYEIIYNVSRKKINRTHDCFDISADLDREINTTFSVQIDAYQEVDGGFKYFESIKDDCACTFLLKYAKENVERALALANIYPPECPLHPGRIRIKNFVMDYTELPKHGVYGTYLAKVYFLYKKKKMNCMQVVLNFDERKYDDSDEDYE